ncbi:MAG: hypothetical protein PHS79_04210 [Patescibacteria group bacterium]|nr:hypothetical protein [Patescibacteria group bacterium]
MSKSIYLGSSSDPQPVFRNEAADAADWPEGAVMAIAFKAEDFPGAGCKIRASLPCTEYYGSDGWPIDLPSAVKQEQPWEIKRELQVYPWLWREMKPSHWVRARSCPEAFEIARKEAAIVRALVKHTSKLCDG